MKKTQTLTQQPKISVSTLSWFILVACVFLFRTYAWTTSELWYDETLTLQRFILPHLYEDGIAAAMRDYPIANNHLLSTAMHMLWLKLVGQGFNEFVLRFPDILCALGTLALIMFHWRNYLGRTVSGLTGLLFAISPVFTAYAYQLRGYSLTMLLATLAVSGALDLTYPHKKLRGQILLCLSGLLLPLVMPSNLMLAPAIPIFGLMLLREHAVSWKQAILAQLPWCVSILLGAAYYLTIWPQFRGAMAEPNGWNSGWTVLGNLLLALAVHAGALAIPAIYTAFKQHQPLKSQAHLTLFVTILAMLATIVCTFIVAQSGHKPFPRVYLVFLPLATFLAVRWSKPIVDALTPSVSMLAVTILVTGILVERVSEGVTDYQLKQGQIPDNLLQQYYRGATDLREIALKQDRELQDTLLVTDPYDVMSMSMYMMLLQRQQKNVQPTLVLASNQLTEQTKGKLPPLPHLAVLAHSREAAGNLLKQAGLPCQNMREIYRTKSGRRFVFKILNTTPMTHPSAAPKTTKAEGSAT